MEVTMLKKLITFLSLFAFLSVLFYSVFLYYGKSYSLTFNVSPHVVENENKTDLRRANESPQATKITPRATAMRTFTWKNTGPSQEAKISPNVTELTATTVRTLELCPETSPLLVGPLHVEFNTERTLDGVRKEVGSPLQEGGRYKPPDCISRQKVAIIIPFRNRHEHLIHWLYYLHPILIRQQLDYGVYVINQDGEGVFNRAKLMNAGYMEALKEYDYDCFVFSDIDLVPLDDRNLYRCFDQPRHLAVAMDKFNFHLPYNTYFGGVSSLSKQQFLKINGFPNSYWGWGGEDDDIYKRVIFNGMQISRPDSTTGRYKMVKHNRDLHNEPNPQNPGKLSQTQRTMKMDGLNSLQYTVKEIVKDKLYTYITVDIQAPAH